MPRITRLRSSFQARFPTATSRSKRLAYWEPGTSYLTASQRPTATSCSRVHCIRVHLCRPHAPGASGESRAEHAATEEGDRAQRSVSAPARGRRHGQRPQDLHYITIIIGYCTYAGTPRDEAPARSDQHHRRCCRHRSSGNALGLHRTCSMPWQCMGWTRSASVNASRPIPTVMTDETDARECVRRNDR